MSLHMLLPLSSLSFPFYIITSGNILQPFFCDPINLHIFLFQQLPRCSIIDYKFFEDRTGKCRDTRMGSRFHLHSGCCRSNGLKAICIPNPDYSIDSTPLFLLFSHSPAFVYTTTQQVMFTITHILFFITHTLYKEIF